MNSYFLIGENCIVSIDFNDHNGFNNKNCKIYLDGTLNNSLNRKESWIIFIHLIQAKGELVSINDLVRQIKWPGDIEDGKERVKKHIAYIRSAIGDTGSQERLITYDADNPIQYQLKWNLTKSLFKYTTPSILSKNNASSYIERTIELEDLLSNAFRDSNVHAIIGEHGMGKTVLAQCFVRKAYEKGKYEYILFTKYKNNLKDTISQLPTYARLSESKDLFDEKVYLLKDLQLLGKTLLIIDNYENSDYYNELSSDNVVYKELLSTGCDILFTSSTNLEGCYNDQLGSEINVTNICPFPTDKLIERFREIKGDFLDSESNLRYLINNLLKRNTYLVTMAAKLAQKMGVEYVINAFDSLSIENTRPIDDNKDGNKQKPASIYRHYCDFLQKHPIVGDSKYTKLLANLSLLPLEGLKYEDFFEIAFEGKQRNENKELFAELVDHFLAFENDDTIYLHPIIREYIVDKLLSEEKFISSYLNCSIRHLTNETYSQDIIYWLNIGQDIENSLKNKEDTFCLWSRACLNAYVASSYDVISIKESAYLFATQAIKLLDKVNTDNLTNNDKLIVANCYNVSGYAILHRSNEFKQEDWDLAHCSILKAMQILNEIENNLDNADFMYRIMPSLTKIHGNIGACYLKVRDYNKAKEWHERARDERQKMLSNNDCKENRLLIYASYRCLGTDYFYLSMNESVNKTQFLKESYENHKKSLQGYIDIYGLRSLECAIGSNRLIGSGIELISALQNDESLKEILGETFDELIDYFYMLINESIAFLSNVGFAINSEIKDSLQKIKQLTELLETRNMLSKDKLDFNKTVVENLNTVPGISENVQELLEKVLTTSQKKVK